jgi:hypothetical protein
MGHLFLTLSYYVARDAILREAQKTGNIWGSSKDEMPFREAQDA